MLQQHVVEWRKTSTSSKGERGARVERGAGVERGGG